MPTIAKRSPLLLDRTSSLLMVVDLQAKLLPAIEARERIVWNAGRLLTAAHTLQIPHLITEQYPERLGATVPLFEPTSSANSTTSSTASITNSAISKRMFSCRECHEQLEPYRSQANQVVICGIESHVCVLQTALDLFADAWQVHVVVDAVSSRSPLDHQVALDRLSRHGVTLTTTESVLFEWCETSHAPEFKSISALVKQVSP